MGAPVGYYNILAQIESGNNPFAKNPSSSASGLYQFTRSTWEGLGFNWSDRFDTNTQNQAVQIFTNQNANYLTRNGISVDAGSLYAAHFFGAGTATRVLGASNDTSIASLVSSKVLNANPFLKGMNVGGFRDWLARKTTGVNGSTGGDLFSDIVGMDAQTAAQLGLDIMSGDWLGASSTLMGESGNPLSDFLAWLKEVFSINTAVRTIFIIIGIILLIGAIISITKVDRVVVDTLQEAGKVAATAAV